MRKRQLVSLNWLRRTWMGWTTAYALLLGIASVALMVLGVALILWSQQS